MLRTHTCGELTDKQVGETVTLCGWADTIREHGKVNFVDLRDRYGKTQIVIIGKHELKHESCVAITGEVKARKEGTENKDMQTGKIEVKASEVKVFSHSAVSPIEINTDQEASDEVRMKYRFLDLRRESMQKKLAFRSKVTSVSREYFEKRKFLEIETPLFVKATPEGARDYIVPSRVNPGKFYALPQSPQLYKQILMIAGFDRYFQLAKCLRDEDLRADRQPDFTQVDFELSFADQEDILTLVEGYYKHVFKEILGVDLPDFVRLTYEESMKKYGTDKPDLRKNKDDPNEYAFCWIIDYPLFSKNEEGGWDPQHHIFSSPKKDHIQFLESDPGKVYGDLFDIVLNGTELGSGSIRISDPELQRKVMKVIGMSEEEAQEKFGFLLDAYDYAGPPHGGMGLGHDRLIALMLGTSDIREVIAFPKNKAAQNPMDGSPSTISQEQLDEVHIKLNLPEKKAKK